MKLYPTLVRVVVDVVVVVVVGVGVDPHFAGIQDLEFRLGARI